MLIAFLALIALVNAVLGGWRSRPQPRSMIFGWVFAPIAWRMGVPWQDAPSIGNLLGTRMALNEFVAYARARRRCRRRSIRKSFTIATFALCGFANFSSIGIQIGGIGALAPTPAPRPGAARASARCSPARWRTSSRRRSPVSCCKSPMIRLTCY